ncbi:MAG: dienelactone hydrolase family protein [Tepidisphaeraceae bacterium]
MTTQQNPHAATPTLTAGVPIEQAKAVVVMIHGRGGSADDILSLLDAFDVPGLAGVAPQAAGHTWYPHSFLAPMDANQPYLDSALQRVGGVVDGLLARGIASEKIALLGFSQGACLMSEFVARNPRRYGAVLALTGGVIGPAGTPRNYTGDLAGTPIFLGCGDPDAHIPWPRVDETAAVFEKLGGRVDKRRYPGRPHTISQDEIDACRALLLTLTQ